MNNFWTNLKYGLPAEWVVDAYLRKNNICHLPLHQFLALRTPSIASGREDPPCPDFVCWTADGQFFVDSKRKSAWVHFNGAQELGVRLDQHEKYRQVARLTRTPVHYYFVHETDGLFRVDSAAGGRRARAGGTDYYNFDRALLTLLQPTADFSWGWSADYQPEADIAEELSAIIKARGPIRTIEALARLAKEKVSRGDPDDY
jgi:hypothetical protein